ncbi:cell division protein FtsL [Pseudobacillus badius]|uniref:cell division protein FtsL n=1 Tax=Bacillus badius TaxID=1455 RepID=UPI0007B03D85|nr:cell division protein FtsL [Bacillus badius]KZO01580.1 cell division protein FtsL [Bacillus badius]MED0667227.1 cell division protein FtsL [Bacillus badius]OCS89974.1 cell division protein FtsL [Bacillus badius]OVE53501.1 cell division protein FtsL [Bacillus badius]TDW05861.1 cell division protein FtsL [Bacillus badius]
MSNLARKQQIRHEEKTAAKQKKQQIEKRLFTPGEKLLFLLFALMICFVGAKIVSTQAALYEINKDIQDVEKEIKDQKKVNHDLEAQVSEESTYERIWKRAKELGLDLSEQNIKVVQPQ